MRAFINAVLFASAFISTAAAAPAIASASSSLNSGNVGQVGQAVSNGLFPPISNINSNNINSVNNPFASIGALNGGLVQAFSIQSQQLTDICAVVVGNIVPQVKLFNNSVNSVVNQFQNGFAGFQGTQFAQFQQFAQSNVAPLLSQGQPVVFDASGRPTFVNFDQSGNVQQFNALGQNVHFNQAGQPIAFVNGIPQLEINGQQVNGGDLSQLFQGQVGQFSQFLQANGQQFVASNNLLPPLVSNGQAVVLNQFGQPTGLQFNQFGQVLQFDNNCQNLLFDARGQAIQFANGLPILRDVNGNLVQVDFTQQLAQFQQSATQVGLVLNINAAGAQNLNALQQIQLQGTPNVNIASSSSNNNGVSQGNVVVVAARA